MKSLCPLVSPFNCLISGPSQSGKSSFVAKIIREKEYLFSSVPQNIVWFYGVWQRAYDELGSSVNKWVEGLPDLEDFDATVHNLLIIDDLMSEADSRVTKLFTKGSHHKNISLIYLVQNLFHKGKDHRTISLNAHYLVLFKNPRDLHQVNHLAKQMYPGNVKFFLDAFKDATTEPYGYLFVDLKQSTPDELRVRTHIFQNEVTEVYIPKKC